MSTISMDKEYKTRDGRIVRVLCVDMEDKNFPVVALVLNTSGGECIESYTAEGLYNNKGCEHPLDLIEVKPKVTYLKPLHKILAEHPGYWFDDDGVIQSVGMYPISPLMFKHFDLPFSEYTGKWWCCESWVEDREV